ncbi:hypothetical protein TNCV_4532031 [Trichonephila clavipes]|nr:hypothetical protein TNCV_4532031 [Trichonephila clavipes]
MSHQQMSKDPTTLFTSEFQRLPTKMVHLHDFVFLKKRTIWTLKNTDTVSLTPSFLPRGRHLSSDDANLYYGLILPRTPVLGIFYMSYNHTTRPLSIICIMKIHRLGPWLKSLSWVQKASDNPTKPPR